MNIKIDIKKLLHYLSVQKSVHKELVLKAAYLIDWKHTLIFGTQLTNAVWHKNGSILPLGFNDSWLDTPYEDIEFNSEQQKVIKFVLGKEKRMKYTEFTHLMFSTYPAIYTERFCDIDMISSAVKYKELYPKHDFTSLDDNKSLPQKIKSFLFS